MSSIHCASYLSNILIDKCLVENLTIQITTHHKGSKLKSHGLLDDQSRLFISIVVRIYAEETKFRRRPAKEAVHVVEENLGIRVSGSRVDLDQAGIQADRPVLTHHIWRRDSQAARDSVGEASSGLQLTVNKIKAIGCVLTRGIQ
ncbi:uncharacterized protein LOC143303071 [Bombus vancouverensis nearcticus]|uniref:uncharacterized protein LOC143303071 n=1 Tax=Bombus vancouverensis nearcticus TaxID=2705178 RepID=UPI00402BBA78